MNRRSFLKTTAALPLLPMGCVTRTSTRSKRAAPIRRVRPGDLGWPSADDWKQLNRDVGGRLLKLEPPLAACHDAPDGPSCKAFFQSLKNPYLIGDSPVLTQTSGWVDAWAAAPSACSVAAENTGDVVAAVNFARNHNLRLVVKGGGHSYQGTSCAPDSLLVWTRNMNRIELHDAFVARGGEGRHAPQPAVSIGAGAVWMQAYDAVTTRGGRYVQGGGCTTVGVAGLVQSGGFGSFSKNYGTAAASLLEAEVVTAGGNARVVNAANHPDLFWGLKGGGGGSLGIVTRTTLRTRELPDYFGAVFGAIRATSDAAYRDLVGRIVRFYAERLFNRHWGEQIVFQRGNRVRISMVLQGLSKQQAEETWRPFLDSVAAAPQDFAVEEQVTVLEVPARFMWNAEAIRAKAPGVMVADDRRGAPEGNVYWAGDAEQVGQVMHAYQSAWLPASLLAPDRQERLADALFAATRHWGVSLHFNKGLAGAPAEEVAAARDTATNPAVLDAFALAISAGIGPPAFLGVRGHEPDVDAARREAALVAAAMGELLKVAPAPGSYVSESDYFAPSWQQSFWGANYPRLAAVKKKYDPDGLFFVRHGVGSEQWSEDGFTRLRADA